MPHQRVCGSNPRFSGATSRYAASSARVLRPPTFSWTLVQQAASPVRSGRARVLRRALVWVCQEAVASREVLARPSQSRRRRGQRLSVVTDLDGHARFHTTMTLHRVVLGGMSTHERGEARRSSSDVESLLPFVQAARLFVQSVSADPQERARMDRRWRAPPKFTPRLR